MKESNVRHFTKTLAVVSLLAPVSGQSLGIGDIQLHSSLNQNLNAQIRLSVADGENPSDVSVRLAPPEKFDQAGVPWNYFLSKLRLEPVVQADGGILVKVTTREVVTEPFLDFLLEVTWPQGSMTREFTLLIDPPTSYNQAVLPAVDATPFSAEPLEPVQRPIRSAPRKAIRNAAPPEPTQPISTDGEFGPVQRSDTLWSIATQLSEERGVSAQQMLNALYKANPGAFNGNINSLKEGAVLKIPAADGMAQAQAKPPRAETAKSSARKPAEATTAKPLELVAPAESKIPEHAVVANQAKTAEKTAQTGIGGTSDQTGDGKALELQARIEKLEQQLGMMQQLLALKDQQLATLQNNKPAQTPADSAAPPPQPQPAPSQQASATPTQPPVAAPEPPPAPAVTTPAPVAEVAQPAPAQAEPAKPRKRPPPPVVVPPPVEEPSFFDSDLYYWGVGGLGTGMLGLLGWLLWRKRKIDERTNTESMFASASQIRMPDTESSLSVPVMDISSTDDYDVGTVGESSFISDFTPSDFDAFDTDQNEIDPISEADVYLAYGRYQQAEELMRTAISEQPHRDECKLKLLEIFYASENRSGFVQFVEELAAAGKTADKTFWNKVSDMAMEIAPDLPLFGGSGVAAPAPVETVKPAPVAAQSAETEFSLDDDFAELDLDLNASLSDGLDFDLNDLTSASSSTNDDLESLDFEIGTVQSAARKSDAIVSTPDSLDFDLAAFAVDSKAVTEAVTPTTARAEPEIESFEFSLTAPETPTELPQDEPASAKQLATDTDELEGFDFNFDVEQAPLPKQSHRTPEPTPAGTELELESFDLSGLEIPADKAADPKQTASSTVPDSFDFDFELDFSEPAKPKPKDTSPTIETLELDSFDFSGFEDNAKTTSTSESPGLTTSDDEFDFNFDFDAPIVPTSADGTPDLGVADLTDMDEFETKIDLAKAYIDMGDTETAKSIANDVLEKGSKQQQAAAQALLDELK